MELLSTESLRYVEYFPYKGYTVDLGVLNGTSDAFCSCSQDFMIQGGDPTGTGRGGESVFGGPFEDEITSSLKHTGAGILSMANSGPNTNRSQFFITLAPTAWLDGKHTIFGRVVTGMGTIEKLGSVQVDIDDKPTESVTILAATVVAHEDLTDISTTK